ncbi:MAG: F0F1 ATP synthase subunit epsilon [Ignavibacteriae bacterium]|nr:MAG: F0F1 ATP synthase subunit epsilon [Ignavibacteriota bacterium]
MSEKSFHLEIVTPRRIVFKGEVTSVSAPGLDGGFQVLHSHAPLLATLKIGKVKLTQDGGPELQYAISGGFMEVKENKAILLAETAERTDEIDIERVKAARDRALTRLAEKKLETDLERAKLALARAQNRLKVAENLLETR